MISSHLFIKGFWKKYKRKVILKSIFLITRFNFLTISYSTRYGTNRITGTCLDWVKINSDLVLLLAVLTAPSSDSKLYVAAPKVWPKLANVKKELNFSSGDLLGSIMSSMVPVAKAKEEKE